MADSKLSAAYAAESVASAEATDLLPGSRSAADIVLTRAQVVADRLPIIDDILSVANPASPYTLVTTNRVVHITGLDHDLTINAPSAGTSGKTSGIEVWVTASGGGRVVTPSGFTIDPEEGSTFTVAASKTRKFAVVQNGTAWEFSGALPLSVLARSTTETIGVGSIELGHADDTTLTRASAGRIAVNGAAVAMETEKQPLDATLTALAGLDTVVGAVVQTGTDTFTKYAVDTDLSSVSGSDDTFPSAKATKSALDLKAPLASPTFTGTVTVPDASFANAKLANMAQDTIKARKTASTGAPEDATAAEARTIIEKSPTSVLTSVSGSLTTATHNGKILVTSGNVTVPNGAGDVGFSAIIIAGGAHTVTFNSLTSAAMAAGDMMTVVVQSTTVIKAVKTLAADLVSFS